jgi:D-beta-D-heptose 7-phosphate kinase/D-beta-D-heptose 1-phosphate adenosyltransferase
LERVVKLANEKDIFVAVDPKDINFPNYRSVSLITPNHHEAGFAAGHKIVNDQDLLEVGQELLVKLDARSILITRGAKGMSLFERSGGVTHIPTFAREVYDVTGAGDTVIAVFVSAMCGGAELSEAAVISNAAAGYTVREIGTATIDRKQLHHELKTSALNGNLVTHTK